MTAHATAELRARVIAVARANPELSATALAERFGRTSFTVSLWLKEAGVRQDSTDMPPRNNRTKAALRKLRAAR